jgi:hypothetical protein
METAGLALHAEATVYPEEPKELRAKTVQHVHDFLRAQTRDGLRRSAMNIASWLSWIT